MADKEKINENGINGLEFVMLRNNFYRDNYRRVVSVLLLMVLINVALVGIIFYQIANAPTPKYFATGIDGRITPLNSLDMPVISQSELLQWAARAATAANTYDFVNYREALQGVQSYFTADGWRNFEAALRGSRSLELVLERKLVVSAVATGTPVILDQGVIGDRYAWKVQVPILVSYQSASDNTQQAQIVTMIIARVPTLNTPKGIAITSFVAGGSA
ncbi:MAG: type IV secretion protein DotI [Gammaproteobacteria bacterium GWE2_37_16]|nr:MAG: type IV secretion protein DotI [Gammaproteobacteria bacterium GWE2_37_16]